MKKKKKLDSSGSREPTSCPARLNSFTLCYATSSKLFPRLPCISCRDETWQIRPSIYSVLSPGYMTKTGVTTTTPARTHWRNPSSGIESFQVNEGKINCAPSQNLSIRNRALYCNTVYIYIILFFWAQHSMGLCLRLTECCLIILFHLGLSQLISDHL